VQGPTHFGPFFAFGPSQEVTQQAICGKNIALRCPTPPFPTRVLTPERGTGFLRTRKATDREVIEAMQHDGQDPRNDVNGEPQRALYALFAGAEGCGPAARSAGLAHHDELADFLCRVQGEIVREAKRLLDQRVAE
jgi:hypothetical protein